MIIRHQVLKTLAFLRTLDGHLVPGVHTSVVWPYVFLHAAILILLSKALETGVFVACLFD